MRHATEEEKIKIINHWQARLTQAHGRETGKRLTKRQLDKQAEFFAGAMSALNALDIELPAHWTLFCMTGREIIA